MASKAKTGRDDEATSAVELTEATESAVARTDGDSTTDTASKLGHHSFLSRLYTGTGAFEVVGRRRLWFGVSGAIVAVAIASIVFRGFTFGIDFKGGTTVSFPRGSTQVAQVEDVYYRALGSEPQSVVIVGAGASATVQIRSETLTSDQTAKLRDALFEAFGPKGTDGQPSKQAISDSAVSETWGGQITKKAVIALVVFLVLVALYITVRYERYMTISAITAMLFDLTVTAGVYSLVGFEVTPATVIGLLTILGFSLYDTVIVFDKVEENTHGFQHTTRRTFAEQANLAINQTFMRSINTSLIGVLPVLALMVVAVWLLGVGTLKDLALVQLIGIIIGTYSSIFFATPLLVTLRERTELVRNHTRRVLKRRNSGSPAGSEDASTDGGEQPAAADEQSLVGITQASSQSAPRAAQGSSKPAPGRALGASWPTWITLPPPRCTPPPIEAMAAVQRTIGNASSLHTSGRSARRRIEEARELIADKLGARPSEVIFTAGGTESDNLAVKGIYWARRDAEPHRRRIVTTEVEHHAVLDSVNWLVEHEGAHVTWLPTAADGSVSATALREALQSHDDVALVSVMWANNEVGTILPIAEMSVVAMEFGVPMHSDAIQAVGQLPLDFGASGLSAMSVAGHKFGGPPGVGALLLRRDVTCVPLMHGGGQERDIRSGTPDVASAVGMATAAQIAVDGLEENSARLRLLRDRLVEGVLAEIDDVCLNGADDPMRLAGNAHFTFRGCEGDALLMLLDANGIECSTGSACTAGVAQPSHVLIAMGVDAASARGSLRLSLGHTSVEADVDAALEVLPGAVARARRAALAAAGASR